MDTAKRKCFRVLSTVSRPPMDNSLPLMYYLLISSALINIYKSLHFINKLCIFYKINFLYTLYGKKDTAYGKKQETNSISKRNYNCFNDIALHTVNVACQPALARYVRCIAVNGYHFKVYKSIQKTKFLY